MCICVYVLSVVCLMICGPFLNAYFCPIWKIWLSHLIPKIYFFLYDIDSEYLNVSFKLRCFSILSGLLIPCMLYSICIIMYYKLQPTYYILNVLSVLTACAKQHFECQNDWLSKISPRDSLLPVPTFSSSF